MSVFTTATSKRPCRDISETRDFLRQGEETVAGHIESVLAAIGAADRELGAFVAVAGERAIREAEAADGLIARLGPAAWRDRPLLGIALAVKDLVQTQDLPTARGSLLVNRRPRRDAMARARQSRRPSRRGSAAGAAAKPDYQLADEAGFPELLKGVWRQASAARTCQRRWTHCSRWPGTFPPTSSYGR